MGGSFSFRTQKTEKNSAFSSTKFILVAKSKLAKQLLFSDFVADDQQLVNMRYNLTMSKRAISEKTKRTEGRLSRSSCASEKKLRQCRAEGQRQTGLKAISKMA